MFLLHHSWCTREYAVRLMMDYKKLGQHRNNRAKKTYYKRLCLFLNPRFRLFVFQQAQAGGGGDGQGKDDRHW